MHHSFKMSYLEPILVHPVRRQNFGDTVAQKCNPYLIRCLKRHSTWSSSFSAAFSYCSFCFTSFSLCSADSG